MGKLLGNIFGGGQTGQQSGMSPPPVVRTLRPDGTPLPNTQITPDHKGLFGIKGTFRDILGALGDGLSHSSGYSDQRQRERLGDASIGMADDPLQAVRNLSAAGFGSEAMKLLDNTQQNETMKSYRKAQAGNQAAMQAQKQAAVDQQRRGNISSYLGAVGRSKDPAAAYAKVRPMLQKLVDEGGYTDYELPEKYDADTILMGANRGISPKDQVTLDQGDRRVSAYESGVTNANANRDAGTGIKQQNANTSAASLGERRAARAEGQGNISKTFVDDQGVVRTLTKTGKVGTTGVKARPTGKAPTAAQTAVSKMKEGQTFYQGANKFVIKNGKPVYQK